jgi:hypothetical protein
MDALPHLLNRKDESSWQKASASLDASAKIYGYRVDSVHSETFKFLGGLSRADLKDDNKETNNEDEASGDSNSRNDKKRGGDKVTVDKVLIFRMVRILWRKIIRSSILLNMILSSRLILYSS